MTYVCGWCREPLGGEHDKAICICTGRVRRWQCTRVANTNEETG